MIIGRLGLTSYINTLPADWGLVGGGLDSLVDTASGPPTRLNRLLAGAELDVSAVSVAAAFDHADEWLIFDHLCLGCRGEVGSVILFSERPVGRLAGENIAVTSESATSVRLLEILLKRHWRVKASLAPEDVDSPARLLIGDAALKLAQAKPGGYTYDLGRAWRELTGLGFVFAVWCIRRAFAHEHPEAAWAIYHLLSLSRSLGRLEHQAAVERGAAATGLDEAIIREYFAKLVYDMDGFMWTGLDKFARWLGFDSTKLKLFGPVRQPASITESVYLGGEGGL